MAAAVDMGGAMPMDMHGGYDAYQSPQPDAAAYQQADGGEHPAQRLQWLQEEAAQLAAQQSQVRGARFRSICEVLRRRFLPGVDQLSCTLGTATTTLGQSQLQAHVKAMYCELMQVRGALAERLTAAAAAARAEADAWGGGHSAPGPPLPGDLPGLAAELGALTAGVASVQALQVCCRRTHHLHHTASLRAAAFGCHRSWCRIENCKADGQH